MSAMPALAPNATSTGCRLISLDGRTLPLARVRLNGEAGSGLAQIVVEQTFRNPYTEPLSLTYQLPLPADAAVVDFAFQLGDRRIVGQVDRKADARARFEDAVLEGRTAALLEQDRSSVFTQELGNIPPGAEVVAEITVECPLAWRDDGWQWRFPTVIAPRFLGSEGQTPDPDRVSVEVADGELPVDVGVELRITDALTGAPSSPSHALQVVGGQVSLPGDARLDRDVVVRWPVATAEPGISLDVARPEGAAASFGLLTLLPPVDTARMEPVPRDLIVLLDTSGSMGGRPLDQARAFVRGLVAGLGSQDQLELIAFSSRREHWDARPRAMDAKARFDALRWLEKLRAGGGTHMHEAMIEALQPLRAGAQRQVVLISDGLIGFEHQIIHAIRHALPASSRVHTVGVGSGVNRSLTRPSARAGGGVELVVGLDESVDATVKQLLARTGQPQVVDLELRGEVLAEVAPARLPDLFGGAPSVLHLRLRPEGGVLHVTGRTAAGPWSREVRVPPVETGQGRRSVVTRFARERVEDLEVAHAAGDSGVDAQIEALGLEHRIATRLTSWIAISDEVTVDPTDPTRRERVPQALPYGLSAEGLGLREAVPAYGAHMLRAPLASPARPQAVRSRKAAPAKGRGLSNLFGLGRKRSEADADDAEAFADAIPPMEAFAEEAAPMDYADAPRSIAPEREQAPPAPPAWLEATGWVVRFKDGLLVIELTLAEDIAWQPADAQVVDASGRAVRVGLTQPTTRGGPVAAGVTIRLALQLPPGAALPARVELRVDGRPLALRLERR
jgi:Ca-activated chloride channel family protein